MEAEIREQPVLLTQNWPFYEERTNEWLRGKKFDAVLLAARGTSDNAALFARYLIEIYLGVPAILAAPSVLTRYGVHVRYPKTLAIGISQSGAAPDVSEVLSDLRASGHTTLAITNTQGSPITRSAEYGLVLDLAKEQAVAATKTYSASLLALYAVIRALGADLEDPQLPDEAWCDECSCRAEEDAETVRDAENIFALARGMRFCSAEETSLKLMECALLPSLSYSLADFEHGPRALASKQSAAVVFGPTPESWHDLPVGVIEAPERVGTPEPVQPIWDALYGQWLALYTARLKNLDPDSPARLQKVTRTL
jgi:glucosamine--fructose-6-phosphate aminotransferase (isomerizing)